jgi:acetate---CoA ligase (ADP-forming)
LDTKDMMKRLVEPESVAIVGATRKTGEFALNLVQHLLAYGYTGKIYPVNPNASEISGVPAYHSVGEIDAPVDQAVIMTPREAVPGVLKECADKGIACAVVVAQGFNDAGDKEGKELNRQIKEVIRDTGIRVLGPNTFGIANGFINFSSSFAQIRLDKVPIGIICQSGTFFHGFPEIRLVGKGIDIGNACDIGFIESLEYFENDPQVKVIGLHIEGIQDTKRFLETARRISLKKPIIALKTGKSDRAAKAMQSHTGSLAGNTLLWDSALKSAGIIRVNDMEEFYDIVRLFAITPLMKNNRIAVATYSGAAGIMTMDALQGSGVEIGELPSQTAQKLKDIAPPWLHVGNPVDFWPIMQAAPNQGIAMRDIMDILLSDDELGGVMFLQLAFTDRTAEGLRMFLNYISSKYPDKPFISAIPGPSDVQCITGLQQDGKHVAYPTPERAARAFSRLWQYSRLRNGF